MSNTMTNTMSDTKSSSMSHKQNMAFQAEVKEILNLMIHSLYSQKEIFLRELISNASDALDKLRYEALTHEDWQLSDEERCIWLIPDTKAKTLTIQDNGIGMTYDEVVKNIGTIAHSGTREFLKAKQEVKDRPELIGQFGVGFYSSFMVAERVILHTQKAGETEGTVWESSGDGEYTISRAPRAAGHGTTIILQLRSDQGAAAATEKPATDSDRHESHQDFTDDWAIRGTVKKYSDFISYPIKLRVSKAKEGKPEEIETTDEVINSQKALWLRNPSEIKPEEYKEFYHHVAHDWADPHRTIHFKAEGLQEFAALMYIPSEIPYDYNLRDARFGLSLYVKRVFIMGDCEDLLPRHLRFVKGLVDSSDLSLNVSREILQQDIQVQRMQKAVVSKILGHLRDMLHKDEGKERKEYEQFWQRFGTSLKEGVLSDFANREKISDLLLFRSSNSEDWTTLGEYIGRMKPEQKSIYYISGENTEVLKNSPYLERLKEKGYEVLFLTDAIDEWLTRELREFKEKKLVSITGEELDLESDEEKKAKEEEKKQAEEKFGPLKKFIETTLSEQIKEVRFSDRLVDSPVCLVSLSHDPSARMGRILESMGKAAPKTKRILEINPKHPVFDKIASLSESQRADWIEILFDQALLNEGSSIPDPARFGKKIASLMMSAQP